MRSKIRRNGKLRTNKERKIRHQKIYGKGSKLPVRRGTGRRRNK